MSGAVTNNCFHQGNGPQNDLTQDLGRLDIHRIHAVDAEQNQTSNAATQNVIVHKSNLLYFSHRLTPEAQVSAGRFPLSASLLYRSFDVKSISKNVKQIKVSFERRFAHVNKVVKFTLLYKRKVSVLNWPCARNKLFIFCPERGRKRAFCTCRKNRKWCTKLHPQFCAEHPAITAVFHTFTG